MRNLLRPISALRSWLPIAAGLLLFPQLADAQSERPFTGNEGVLNPCADMAPGIVPAATPTAAPDALWDIQFNYNATDTMGRNGMAGAIQFGNEIWVSRWASDTIHKFTLSGQFISTFQIAGLTGVRAFTADSTHIYAATNTTTIYRIDPATATLAPPHTTVNGTVGNVRHCTYSPDLNSSAGGFYVGNFGTSIYAVSRAGAILQTIPAATHGLSGMYGSAYDNTSAGGPFLWVFAQMAPSNSMIYRLQLPSGTQTVINHDVMTDVGVATGLTSGLAGGLFISDSIVSGQRTIGGVIQGTPDNIIFGYELANPIIPTFDARLTSIRPVEGYTRIPVAQLFGESFDVGYSNFGANTLDSLMVDFTVKFGGNTVFTDTRTVTNVATSSIGNVLSNSFTPASGVGVYDVWAVARTAVAQPDSLPSNDTLMFSFQVTDSTYARDNDIPDGGAGYSVGGGGDYALITANYTLTAPATVTAVWVKLATPVTGDTTRAVVTNTISATFPDLVLAMGTPVIINSNQDEYLLNVPGGLALTPGVYSFGCYQALNASIGLAQSADLFTADVNYFFIPGNPWTASGVQTARFIRPVFGTPVGTGTNTAASDFVQLYPNPSNGSFMLAFAEAATESAVVTVTSPMGQVVYQQIVEANGKAVSIAFDAPSSGIYFVNVDNGVHSTTKKLLITK